MNKKISSHLYFDKNIIQLLKSKRSAETIGTEEVIFIILNVLFFSILLFFVVRSSSVDTVLEEVYAKKIALIMDNMVPGMEISLKADELFNQIEKNKFLDFPIVLDKNNIILRTSTKTNGYSFVYFSDIKPEIIINNQLKTITIQS